MRRTVVRVAVVGVVLIAAAAVLLLLRRPALTEQQVRETLYTTIQRESPEAFLITGSLDVTATTRVENSRILLPGIVGLDLGTTRATVRAPGRVSYGFHVDSLRPEMIRMLEDGTIAIQLPTLTVYSVEPRLDALEVETTRGWARLGSSQDAVQQRAIAIITGALGRQGVAHLDSSVQPRLNTARALERMLTPALVGLGMEEPRFRFRIGDQLVVEPSG